MDSYVSINVMNTNEKQWAHSITFCFQWKQCKTANAEARFSCFLRVLLIIFSENERSSQFRKVMKILARPLADILKEWRLRNDIYSEARVQAEGWQKP